MNWPDVAAKVALLGSFLARSGLAPPDTPGHGFRLRVLRDVVRPPAYHGNTLAQDTDAPHGVTQSDE